jgi:hypothetical protein
MAQSAVATILLQSARRGGRFVFSALEVISKAFAVAPKSFEALEKTSGSFPNLRIVLVSPKSFAVFQKVCLLRLKLHPPSWGVGH